MRVLVVCHYFPPETGAPQARLSELAEAWATSDEVTVLTGMPNHPTGVVPERYRRRMRVGESMDGYRVVRTWLYATPNKGMLKKTIGHLSFMVTSFVLGLGPTGKASGRRGTRPVAGDLRRARSSTEPAGHPPSRDVGTGGVPRRCGRGGGHRRVP